MDKKGIFKNVSDELFAFIRKHSARVCPEGKYTNMVTVDQYVLIRFIEHLQSPQSEAAEMDSEEYKIIYKHNKPYGIRDKGGYLFFFTDISKYTGQEERYRKEIEEQYALADYLLKQLQQWTLKGKP